MQRASLCLCTSKQQDGEGRGGGNGVPAAMFAMCVVEVLAESANLGKFSELAEADEAMSDAHSSRSTLPLCMFFPVWLSGKKSLVNRTRLLSCDCAVI